MPKNLVPFNTQSESPDDYCEQCHDKGIAGDNGPGFKGNEEVTTCDCDPVKRARRKLARQKQN